MTVLSNIAEDVFTRDNIPAGHQEWLRNTFLVAELRFIEQEGGFTIAVVEDPETKACLGIGVSKRNPVDKHLSVRGRSLAMVRAVRNVIKTHSPKA